MINTSYGHTPNNETMDEIEDDKIDIDYSLEKKQ